MKVLIIDDIPDTVKDILDYCEEQHWEKSWLDLVTHINIY